MEDTRAPVVVGIDGSASSRGALRWAVDEASARGLPLRVLHAARSAEPELWSASRAMIADAVSVARQAHPEVEVSGEVIDGKPVIELCSAAERADLVVVGSRGIGGFAELSLGAVSSQVALHAHSPVTVVHNGEAIAESEPEDLSDLPVLVGADSSHESEKAIGVAFEEASVRGVPLIAIRAWRPPQVAYRGKVRHSTVDRVAIEATAGLTVLQSVNRWRPQYPHVTVETRVEVGSPAGALVAASRSAQLIVVGSRGHSSFAGPRLGATTTQLLHHGCCPVMIVRSAASPATGV